MKRGVVLILLLCALARTEAAIQTTSIVGQTYLSGGTQCATGTLKFTLNRSGTTLDGTVASPVGGTTTTCNILIGEIGGCSVIPNDAIMPAGTYYEVRVSCTQPQSASWLERVQVATSPDPSTYGALTRIDVVPGIERVVDWVRYVAIEPTGGCTPNEQPRLSIATTPSKLCKCSSGTWVCDAPGGASDFGDLGAGTNTAAAMLVGTGASLAPTGSGTVTANQVVGSGSTTNAVDLATAEVAGVLPDGNVASTIARDSELPVAANPSGTIGMSANNGVATTFMRSDGRPAIDPSIAPTWLGTHIFDAGTRRSGQALATIGDFWSYVTVGNNTSHPEGATIDDSVWRYLSYNFNTSNNKEVAAEHAAWCQFEATWSPDGVQEWVEDNCDYLDPEGTTKSGDGDGSFRWYITEIVVRGYCSGATSTSCRSDSDCVGFGTCVNDDTASHKWSTYDDGSNPAGGHLEVISNGKVRFSKGITGASYIGGFCAGTTTGASNDGTQCDVDGDCTGTGAACYFEDTGGSSATESDIERSVYVRTNRTSSPDDFYSFYGKQYFDSTTTDAQVNTFGGMRFDQYWFGSATGRDISQWNAIQLVASTDEGVAGEQTGSGATLGTFRGVSLNWSNLLAGNNVAATTAIGLEVLPLNGTGTSSTLGSAYGLWIGDLNSYAPNQSPIYIKSQTSGSNRNKGNLKMEGGGFLTGHIQLENGHLYHDATDETLRFWSDIDGGFATAENSGAPWGAHPGTDNNWGNVLYGNATAGATHDTGAEICDFADLVCVDAWNVTTYVAGDGCSTVMTNATCTGASAPWACCSGSGTGTCDLFIALCKNDVNSAP